MVVIIRHRRMQHRTLLVDWTDGMGSPGGVRCKALYGANYGANK